MFVCVLCRFETELDDVIAPVAGGRCVCLRCFHRETESCKSMSKQLRRDLMSTLAGGTF
jgi:hypothetical protein